MEAWGGETGEESAAHGTLHGHFAAQARRSPEAPAVTCGETVWTYGELAGRAHRLAWRLRELGVGPEDRVGLCCERSPELLAGLIGILAAGAAYVPLDPAYPADRLAYMMSDAGVRAVVGTASALASLPVLGEGVTAILLDRLEGFSTEPPPASGSAANLAYVIYTSGSTGRPKGTLISHGHVLRLFSATEPWFGFHERDVWTLFHSYAFDFSVWEIWGALLYGGRLAVVPQEVSRTPDAFHDLLAREGVTVLNQTPSAFAQLDRVDAEPHRAGPLSPLRALRLVIFGGEALDLTALAPWLARHGDRAPRLVNMYGITETTVHVTYKPLRVEDARERRSLIGVPIPDLALYVLDPWLQPAPLGVPGELVVGGAGLARGYLGRPDLTAARFVPDPLSGRPGARLYRSGDLGRFLPHGDVEVLGRIDHQVKIRGFRIELGEIQAALEAHPGVLQALVLAREEAGGGRRLAAFVVPRPDQAPEPGALRAFLAGRLPDYMVPAGFVLLDSFPLTGNGKVDRKALLAQAVAGRDEAVAFQPPRDATEEALARIWQEVLGVERVGIADNFFTLGGDSILSIRVRSRAAEEGLAFDLQDLFRLQTIGELAAAVRRAPLEETPALEPFALVRPEDRERLARGLDGLEDAYPPSFLQLGMLFHSARADDATAYHYVTRFVLRGPFDPAALARAVERLAVRHPALRTSFDTARFGEPLQLVHRIGRQASIEIATADLRALSPEERERVRAERFAMETERRFDWSRPGLLRFWAFALPGDTFELGITLHHAILDGWSFSTLLAELFADATAPPPPASIVRDFIALERQALESDESRAFWRGRLAGHTVLALPRWPGRPAAPSPRVQKLGLVLPPTVNEALGRFTASAGLPVKSALLAVHLRVLELLGGNPDVLTGLVANGRPEVEGGDRSIGLFLNTVPLRLDLVPSTWTGLARAAFAAEADLLPHRRFPLAEIQRRWSGGAPLFEVSFNYTHFHVLGDTAARVEVVSSDSLAETNFPLAVRVTRSPAGAGGLFVELAFDAAELHLAQVRSWLDLYARLTADLAAHPDRPWTSAPVLSEAERHQLAMEWNDTAPSAAGRTAFPERFEAWARRTPDAPAVVCEESVLSYGDLNARANRVARRLQALGVGPEDRVALFTERSTDMIAGLLAVLKTGAACVPLDPAFPDERLAFVLADTGARAALTQSGLAGRLPATLQRLFLNDEATEEPGGDLGVRIEPASLAYVIYTSGSTGRPKGVAVGHRQLAGYVDGVIDRLDLRGCASFATVSTLAADLGHTAVFPALALGACLHVISRQTAADPAAFAAAFERHAVDVLKIVPSHLAALQSVARPERGLPRRRLVLGGEACAWEQAEAFQARAPECRIFNHYGPTETTVGVLTHPFRPGERPAALVPLGRPLPGSRVHVLDRRAQLVPPGAPGELYIGGHGLARGYLGRPDLTAERFVPDPFAEDGGRLYRTGDRVIRLPDGALLFLGRADHQVKIRGFRVEPGEIEAALRALPHVTDAVVVPRTRPDGDRHLVAYVTGAGVPEPGALREALARSLPSHMVPAAFVALPALPLTPNGKLDRAALPEPGPALGDQEDRIAVPPRDDLELRLVQLWEDLLDVRPVGIRDDFFALGGHSLLALRLMGSLERLFDRRVPLATLLEAPTVEGLAHLLRQDRPHRSHHPHPPLAVPLRSSGDGPPLFLVHPVGGNVLCYRALAESLSSPLFGLQAPEPEELPQPWTLETMAALYLEAVREVQPAGPYRLGGWSLGGIVAYEMARQLEAEGSPVALLALIDVAPPGPRDKPDPLIDLAGFVHDLKGLVGLADTGPLALPEGATLESLLEREDVRALLPPDLDADRLRGLFSLYQANRRALEAYRPGPYGGHLTLIRSEATAAADPGGAFSAWKGLAGQGAEIHVLPGDHYSLLRPPAVAAVSALLASPSAERSSG